VFLLQEKVAENVPCHLRADKSFPICKQLNEKHKGVQSTMHLEDSQCIYTK